MTPNKEDVVGMAVLTFEQRSKSRTVLLSLGLVVLVTGWPLNTAVLGMYSIACAIVVVLCFVLAGLAPRSFCVIDPALAQISLRSRFLGREHTRVLLRASDIFCFTVRGRQTHGLSYSSWVYQIVAVDKSAGVHPIGKWETEVSGTNQRADACAKALGCAFRECPAECGLDVSLGRDCVIVMFSTEAAVSLLYTVFKIIGFALFLIIVCVLAVIFRAIF